MNKATEQRLTQVRQAKEQLNSIAPERLSNIFLHLLEGKIVVLDDCPQFTRRVIEEQIAIYKLQEGAKPSRIVW